MKGEVGMISKQILERVNNHIRKTTKLNQWISHTDTIQWFKRIENKRNKRFIQVDVVFGIGGIIHSSRNKKS